MTLAAAIAIATLFAIFGPPYRHYLCWFTWAPKLTVVGTLLYLTLAGVGGGFVGWLTAEALKAAPTESAVVNGLLFGVGGALAIRADFSPAREPRGQGASFDTAQAISLLGVALVWCTQLLDSFAERRSEIWFGSLDDRRLILQAHRLVGIITDMDITDAAKKALMSRLVPAMALVRGGDAAKRDEGRVLIVQFCVRFCIDDHLGKPPGFGVIGPASHDSSRAS